MKTIAKAIDLFVAIMLYKRKLSALLDVPLKEVGMLYDEIYASGFFKDLKSKAPCPAIKRCFSMVSPYRAPLFYVLCRVLKPEVVVETGVKDGYSSGFILKALETNNKGRLFSIDLPNAPGQELLGQATTGWLVPQELRPRWELIIGSSRDKLPGMLDMLGEIDIFYHDSDHSYENMMFEFKTAWDYIRNKGCLLSDDITENSAFDDFVKSRQCTFSIALFKTGIIKK
jgi:predicted O-methyltransferase YrrM